MEYKLNHAEVLNLLPDRKADAHKGDFGRVLLLCGSRGYTGAAALAAMGALRAGAGLVYLAVPESIYEVEAIKLLEPIVIPIKERDGMLSIQAWDQIKTLLPQMDAVLFGPGLRNTAEIGEIAANLLSEYHGPIILDADGINCLSDHKDILRGRTEPVVLTPHQGEFDRLRGCPCKNRVDDAVRMACDLGIIVVLKGHRTIITNGEDVYENQTGNPGMAVGGSGDILAGMIVGLVGQGIEPIKAAAAAVWLHGAAGDICAHELGQYAMLPSDMLSVLPRLMK